MQRSLHTLMAMELEMAKSKVATWFAGAKYLEVSITHLTLNNLGLIFLRCWFNTSLYYYPGSSSALTLCLQHCSMLALFISSLYKWHSDIWACSDAPSISSLNMCLPDQDGGWRLRWSMLQICCTEIMYQTGRDVAVGEKFCSGLCHIKYAIVLRNGLCVERGHRFWIYRVKWWGLWNGVFFKKKCHRVMWFWPIHISP